MNDQYSCPECKNKLIKLEEKLFCEFCNLDFSYKNKISIFSSQKNNFERKIKFNIKQINVKGYDNAIEDFLLQNPELKSALTYTKYDQSADVIFHNIGNRNIRCLEINSEFGNRVEILSNIFEQVYSVEFINEYLEFQKKRFDERKRVNISILKCDIDKFPFPDNFFDLILCNGVINNITKFSNVENPTSKFLKELKRLINDEGKIVFSVGQKINENNNEVKMNGKHFSKIQKILKNEGLNVKPYWVFPSHEKPYFSGPMNQEIPLRWFFKNLQSFMGRKDLPKKEKILFSVLKKLNHSFLKKLLELYSPSFIFCCEKKILDNTLEDWIKRDSKYNNFLMISRRVKILFVLLNKSGFPEKKVVVRRYGNKFPDQLQFFDRKFPNLKDPKEKCWIEDWFSGRSVIPLNKNEIELSINWLINFQNETKQNLINDNDVGKEIELIKKGLELVPHGNISKYHQWLEEYRKFMRKNPIYSTAVHGDFWVSNILFSPKENKVNIIDWELSKEKGNPLLDISTFIFNLMASTSNDPLKTFEKNLKNQGESFEMIEEVKKKIEKHFGFKVEFISVLRYYLMKKMVPKEEELEEELTKNRILKSEPTLYMKMLDLLSEK